MRPDFSNFETLRSRSCGRYRVRICSIGTHRCLVVKIGIWGGEVMGKMKGEIPSVVACGPSTHPGSPL